MQTGLDEKRKGKGFKILRVARRPPTAENLGGTGRPECMSQSYFVNTHLSELTLFAVFIFVNFSKMTNYLLGTIV